MEYKTYGRHIIVDVWGVDFEKINDMEFLKEHMMIAAEKSGAAILEVSYQKFHPAGATVLVLLSESHLSIHSYPEKGFAAIDGYTCGDKVDPEDAIKYLIHIFNPTNVYIRKVIRGEGELVISKPII